MDSSRPRCTSHGALHETMVLGIVNVSEPFGLNFESLHSQLLRRTTVSYYTFFSGYVMTLRKKMHLEDYVQWYFSCLFA